MFQWLINFFKRLFTKRTYRERSETLPDIYLPISETETERLLEDEENMDDINLDYSNWKYKTNNEPII